MFSGGNVFAYWYAEIEVTVYLHEKFVFAYWYAEIEVTVYLHEKFVFAYWYAEIEVTVYLHEKNYSCFDGTCHMVYYLCANLSDITLALSK